ncbi:MAG: hypothetical protein JOZ08_25065 [Verrucomicrobia bacterium]|nr:hypothetical protein [Verrucomicrobiota bacterium]MBV8274725.1 hypothetical protein [Verrucomicrobiota bacterium]
MALIRNNGRVSQTARTSVISAVVYIIEQKGRDDEPITLGLEDGEIVVHGYGRRSLGRISGMAGLNFSYDDVLSAEQLLAESLSV